jgi:hypothetical protein
MVGGLSSQVENAAGISQIDHPVEGSASAESAAFGEQSFGISNVTSEPPQVPENFGVLEVAKNGDLVVGEGFWTVFCQEVRADSSILHLLNVRSQAGLSFLLS